MFKAVVRKLEINSDTGYVQNRKDQENPLFDGNSPKTA